MSEAWEDVQGELNAGTGQFFKPHKLEVGKSEEIVVVRYAKHTMTKYPIKDKEGNSLGYTWRFFLKDGSVWDVSNANRRVLLQGLHPEGQKEVTPGRFKVTNLGVSVNKKPATQVEYLGTAVGVEL